MKVVVTHAAKADLADIGEFIPVRIILHGRLVSLINRSPICLALVPRYERHGIRPCMHRDYLIFYRVIEDPIEVIHILHGARNDEVLLFPEETTVNQKIYNDE